MEDGEGMTGDVDVGAGGVDEFDLADDVAGTIGVLVITGVNAVVIFTIALEFIEIVGLAIIREAGEEPNKIKKQTCKHDNMILFPLHIAMKIMKNKEMNEK